jgi:hypothetical protein
MVLRDKHLFLDYQQQQETRANRRLLWIDNRGAPLSLRYGNYLQDQCIIKLLGKEVSHQVAHIHLITTNKPP